MCGGGVRDDKDGTVRTASQRRADALVEMARRSAALDHGEVAEGRRSRVVLSVVLGLDAFEHLCELLEGTPITRPRPRTRNRPDPSGDTDGDDNYGVDDSNDNGNG